MTQLDPHFMYECGARLVEHFPTEVVIGIAVYEIVGRASSHLYKKRKWQDEHSGCIALNGREWIPITRCAKAACRKGYATRAACSVLSNSRDVADSNA